MVADVLPDEFRTGVWYDAHYGDFVTFATDPTDTDTPVILRGVVTGEEVARIALGEFEDVQSDFHAVPEAAVSDPAGHFEAEVARLLANLPEFDPGLHYADYMTEIVALERDTPSDETTTTK